MRYISCGSEGVCGARDTPDCPDGAIGAIGGWEIVKKVGDSKEGISNSPPECTSMGRGKCMPLPLQGNRGNFKVRIYN